MLSLGRIVQRNHLLSTTGTEAPGLTPGHAAWTTMPTQVITLVVPVVVDAIIGGSSGSGTEAGRSGVELGLGLWGWAGLGTEWGEWAGTEEGLGSGGTLEEVHLGEVESELGGGHGHQGEEDAQFHLVYKY